MHAPPGVPRGSTTESQGMERASWGGGFSNWNRMLYKSSPFNWRPDTHTHTHTGAPNQWCHGSLWSHPRRLWSGLAARWLVHLFGVPNEDTSKNREIRQALALGGCRSMMRDNDQLGVGGRIWRHIGEEAHGSCSVWGGGIQSFEVTNSAQKKMII